jgi:hypothetical protein
MPVMRRPAASGTVSVITTPRALMSVMTAALAPRFSGMKLNTL